MSIEISQREKEGVMILDLKGSLTAGDSSGVLRDTTRKMVADGRRNVVLNLAEVDYIDSTGLGALVMFYTVLRKASGRLALLNLNRRHMELLVLTTLSTVFEIFDDEQSAVNSFFPNRQIRHFDILDFVEKQRRETDGEPS